MVDMVVNQRSFGVGYCLFNSKELLGDVSTSVLIVQHGNNLGKMPVGAFQARFDLRVRSMRMCFHGDIPILPMWMLSI